MERSGAPGRASVDAVSPSPPWPRARDGEAVGAVYLVDPAADAADAAVAADSAAEVCSRLMS